MAKSARARIDKRREHEQEVKVMDENTATVQSTELTGEAEPDVGPVQSTELTGETEPDVGPVQSTELTGEAEPDVGPVQSTELGGNAELDYETLNAADIAPAQIVYSREGKRIELNPYGSNTPEQVEYSTRILNAWAAYVNRHSTENFSDCYSGFKTCYPKAARLVSAHVATLIYNNMLMELAHEGEDNAFSHDARASWVSYVDAHKGSDTLDCYKVWSQRNPEYAAIVTSDTAGDVYKEYINKKAAEEEEKKSASNTPVAFGHLNINLIQLPEKLSFKSKELEASTKRIAECFNSAVTTLVEKNRMIAIELAKVEAAGDYGKEGFSSLAEYAAKYFNFKKANTYMLAKAGKVYLDDTALPAVKALTPHKLAELNSVNLETINKAFADGELTASSTSKDLRQFAESVARKNVETTPQEGVVTKVYTPYIKTATYLPGQTVNINFAVLLPREIPEWDEYITKEVFDETGQGKPTITKLPKLRVKSGDTTREFERRCYMTADIYMIVAYELSLPPKETTEGDDKAKARQERIDNAPAALRPMLQGLSDAELDKLLGL